MLHLIISPQMTADDRRSQTETSREELELHRLQQCRTLRGRSEPATLLLHLGQEGGHLTEGLQAHLTREDRLAFTGQIFSSCKIQNHDQTYLSPLLLLQDSRSNVLRMGLTARVPPRLRGSHHAATDELEGLVENRQGVVARVG